ncbi:MAG: hypothetical protein RMJ43_05535 [Chloroherpetonaceae bacterium]|nr:peptidylprolyl isomerase [Chthonomonadaceae bacterium]MDW8207277.1 hypothetical protein [Chloroherpetonaceae bacterium]
MRFLRVLVVVALIASLGLNFILYKKYRSGRAIITLNGEGITRRDIDGWLEQQAGPRAKALFVQRVLVNQEAKKQGVLPTQQEVEEEFARRREENWQFARQVDMNPWMAGEMKKQIQEELAKIRLMAKDVPVTEEEMREEYRQNPMRYDTPNKARVNLAVVLDASIIGEVRQLLQKKDPPVSPTVIMSQYVNKVVFLGHENRFTFMQPFGNNKVNAEIFKMQKDEVRQFPPGEFARQGARAILVRMLEKIPGKKADLNDPKVKEQLRIAVASRRWSPWQEKLVQLWDNAVFYSEDPNDKRNIEMVLFPDRARAEASR